MPNFEGIHPETINVTFLKGFHWVNISVKSAEIFFSVQKYDRF